MFSKSVVDMSRAHLLYGGGIGALMLASLAVSNVPALELSQYLELPYRKEICAGLFLGGALMGCLALMRHASRLKKPWKIPQSQVTLPYTVFFLMTFAAISLAR
jgi:hypothetical protein